MPVTSPAASRNSAPFDASRAAEVATRRPRTTENLSITCRNSLSTDEATFDGFGSQPSGGVDAGPQSGDPHETFEGRSVAVDDQKAGGVGAAVDGGDAFHSVHLSLLPRRTWENHPGRLRSEAWRQVGWSPIR